MFNGTLKVGLCLVVCLAVAAAASTSVGPAGPPEPGPKDRCATCGMLVAKFPSWVASIVYVDGSHRFFDGPKDMFRFRALHHNDAADEAEIWVTDYYTTKALPAHDAVYVLGSDVLGPMGPELVPFASRELAESFREDHGGDAPLAFEQVDAAVLRSLD